MNKTSRRESLESLRIREREALLVVVHFPFRGVVEMPDIRSASRLILFALFCLAGISLFMFGIDFPTCFMTVADRSAIADKMKRF